MVSINRDRLIPVMENYKKYLIENKLCGDNGEITNTKENYKRDQAKLFAGILQSESWKESEIGTGAIGKKVIEIINHQKNSFITWRQKPDLVTNITNNWNTAEG